MASARFVACAVAQACREGYAAFQECDFSEICEVSLSDSLEHSLHHNCRWAIARPVGVPTTTDGIFDRLVQNARRIEMVATPCARSPACNRQANVRGEFFVL